MNANLNEILKEIATDLSITTEEAYLLMLLISESIEKGKTEDKSQEKFSSL